MKKGSKYILIFVFVIAIVLLGFSIFPNDILNKITGNVVQQTTINYSNINFNLTEMINTNTSRYCHWNGRECVGTIKSGGSLGHHGDGFSVVETGSVAGEWTRDFEAAKALAKTNKVFFIAVITSPSGCAYCNTFDTTCLSRLSLSDWVKSNGIPMVYASTEKTVTKNWAGETTSIKYIYPPFERVRELYFGRQETIPLPTVLILDENGGLVSKFVARYGVFYNGIKYESTPETFTEIIGSFVKKYTSTTTASSAAIASSGYNINWNLSSYIIQNASRYNNTHNSFMNSNFPPQCYGLAISGGYNDPNHGVLVEPIDRSGAVAGEWTRDFEAAKALAKINHKPIIINFGQTSGCSFCTTLQVAVYDMCLFADWAKSNGIPMVYADDTGSEGRATVDLIYSTYYRSGSVGFPDILVVDENGNLMQKFPGRSGAIINGVRLNPDPESFVNILKTIVENYTMPIVRSAAAVSAPTANKSITSFRIITPSTTGIINETAKTISIVLPVNTNVNSLTPIITTNVPVTTSIVGATAGEWTTNVTAAKMLAARNNRTIIIDIGTQACGLCKLADEKVFNKIEFKEYAAKKGIPLLKLDAHTINAQQLMIGASPAFPFLVIYKMQSNEFSNETLYRSSSLNRFIYRDGQNVNGILVNLNEGPSNFIRILESVTGPIPDYVQLPQSPVSPASGVPRNFTNPVIYTVTGTDKTNQSYIVSVSYYSNNCTGNNTFCSNVSMSNATNQNILCGSQGYSCYKCNTGFYYDAGLNKCITGTCSSTPGCLNVSSVLNATLTTAYCPDNKKCFSCNPGLSGYDAASNVCVSSVCNSSPGCLNLTNISGATIQTGYCSSGQNCFKCNDGSYYNITLNKCITGMCSSSPGCLNETAIANANVLSSYCPSNQKCFECNSSLSYNSTLKQCTVGVCSSSPGCLANTTTISNGSVLTQMACTAGLCFSCDYNFAWNNNTKTCVSNSSNFTWRNTYLTPEELELGSYKIYNVYDKINFNIDSISYIIYVLSYSSGATIIKIASLPNESTLTTGRMYSLDINQDSEEDVNISISSANNNSINMSIALLYQFIATEDLSEDDAFIITDDGSDINIDVSSDGTDTIDGALSESQGSLSTTTIWILIASIFLVLILIIVIWYVKTRNKDESNDAGVQSMPRQPPVQPPRNQNNYPNQIRRF